ncbi:MAG: acyltransferase [Opitutaceae bacterium]|nr:acyltransferase [Opitutaceae bacterium]
MTTTPKPPAARSGTIDAWRALACLAVVLFHASETVVAGEAPSFVMAIAAMGRQGWLGVPVFFVISGYCLAQAVESRARRKVPPVIFWFDRLLRIYPVYWTAFLLTLALALIATPFNHLPASSALPSSAHAWLANLTLTSVWQGVAPKLPVRTTKSAFTPSSVSRCCTRWADPDGGSCFTQSSRPPPSCRL